MPLLSSRQSRFKIPCHKKSRVKGASCFPSNLFPMTRIWRIIFAKKKNHSRRIYLFAYSIKLILPLIRLSMAKTDLQEGRVSNLCSQHVGKPRQILVLDALWQGPRTEWSDVDARMKAIVQFSIFTITFELLDLWLIKITLWYIYLFRHQCEYRINPCAPRWSSPTFHSALQS